MYFWPARVALAAPAAAHHGWGSYDAAKPVTVTGPITTVEIREPARHPHGEGRRQDLDRHARADLAHEAPAARSRPLVAVGKTVSAYGYPSTVEKDEMRAERITVDGKTYEMR